MGGSVSVFKDVDVNAFTLEWIEVRSLGTLFFLNVTFKHVDLPTSTQYVLRGHYAWVKDGIYVGPDHKEVKGDTRHHFVNTNELTVTENADGDDEKSGDEADEKPRPKTDFKTFNDCCRPYDLQYTQSGADKESDQLGKQYARSIYKHCTGVDIFPDDDEEADPIAGEAALIHPGLPEQKTPDLGKVEGSIYLDAMRLCFDIKTMTSLHDLLLIRDRIISGDGEDDGPRERKGPWMRRKRSRSKSKSKSKSKKGGDGGPDDDSVSFVKGKKGKVSVETIFHVSVTSATVI